MLEMGQHYCSVLCRIETRLWKTVFVLPLCFSLAQASISCGSEPISVAIRNVSVANGASDAIARGMAISVGSPPQEIAFMPLWYNNSFVFDSTNLCTVPSGASYPPLSCVTVRGGAYNPFVSTTQQQGVSESLAADPSSPSTTIYNDLFTLDAQKNITLTDYTFGVPLADWGEQYYTPSAMIGLGSNSTFLNDLKSRGMIASRSFAFFWGRTGSGQQSNGSVVFGGYDHSKIQGTTNYTQPLNYTNCKFGTSMEVSNLGLFFLDGSEQSLYNATADQKVELPLFACIDPGEIGVANIPYNNYFKNFVDITGYDSFTTNGLGSGTIRSTGYNFWDLLYLPGDTPFLGDLSVEFKNGPSIRVKNEEIVVPHVFMDQTAHTWQENTSLSDLRFNSAGTSTDFSNSNDMRFGRDFMNYVYLMINHDSGTFTIWPAFEDATTEDLRAVDENNQEIQTCVSTSAASSSTPTGPSSNPAGASSSPASSSKISTGAIAGIAIGGVVVLAILLGAILFFRRRKQKQTTDSQYTPTPETPEKLDHSAISEVSGDNRAWSPRPPSELPSKSGHTGDTHPIHQSYEMPAS